MRGAANRKYKNIWNNKYLYLMFLPGFLYFLIFRYIPIAGLVVAFKDYSIVKGIWGSEWVGFAQFKRLFSLPEFYMVLKNTLLISLYKILSTLPIPVILALFLNELKNKYSRKISQTIIFTPYMMSWVVIAGIFIAILSPTTGVAKVVLEYFNIEPFLIIATAKYFKSVLVVSNLWYISGWYVVFYMASIASIDISIYEAATIDGASKWQQMWSITLPLIKPTIITLLVLSLGKVMEAGFEQVFAFYSPSIRSAGEIIDTYVYSIGIKQGDFSFSTAVGFFKSIINLVLILLADRVAKRLGERGLI